MLDTKPKLSYKSINFFVTLANQEIRFFPKIGFLNSFRHSTQSVEEGVANQEIRFFPKIGFLNSFRHSTQSVEEGVPKQNLGTRKRKKDLTGFKNLSGLK
jgi:hypothetical protein